MGGDDGGLAGKGGEKGMEPVQRAGNRFECWIRLRIAKQSA